MNKIERELYLTLSSEIDFCLCSFCSYSRCETGYSPCDTGEPYCTHPLEYRMNHLFEFSTGDDCWGFRPAHSVSFITDIVGIILQNGWESAVWWKNKKGNWKVAEV